VRNSSSIPPELANIHTVGAAVLPFKKLGNPEPEDIFTGKKQHADEHSGEDSSGNGRDNEVEEINASRYHMILGYQVYNYPVKRAGKETGGIFPELDCLNHMPQPVGDKEPAEDERVENHCPAENFIEEDASDIDYMEQDIKSEEHLAPVFRPKVSLHHFHKTAAEGGLIKAVDDIGSLHSPEE
jgi:hypothetical protein